jgi:hypothetical protein
MDSLEAAILEGDLALREEAESVGVAVFEGQDDHADLGGIQRCARPCRRLR